jgi:uncharacterized membrane protein YhaH (DUF805 family)
MSRFQLVARDEVSFGQAISAAFGNYVNFSDRSCRSEFWYWTLFTIIVAAVPNIGNAMLRTYVVNLPSSLPFIIPGFAIGVRRLHDIDRGGVGYFYQPACFSALAAACV